MPVNIAEGEIDSVRFLNQDINPDTPASGYTHLYTTESGLFTINPSGEVEGPYIDNDSIPGALKVTIARSFI